MGNTVPLSPRFFLIAALLATLFSFFSAGYGALISDQQIYLPSILQAQHPELLRNDFLLTFRQTDLTFFDELVVGISNLTSASLYWILFWGIVVARFVYFYSLARLAGFLNFNRIEIFLVAFVSAFSIEVYGSGIKMVEAELHPRFFALALGLLFLVALFENRKILAVCILGLGFFMHPLTSLVFISFYYWRLFKEKGALSKSLIFWVVPLIYPLITLGWLKVSGASWAFGNNPFLMDGRWLEIASERATYLFLSSWKLEYLLWLLGDGLLLFYLFRASRDRKESAIFGFLVPLPVISGAIFLATLIFSDGMKIAFLVSMQLSRVLLIWKLILAVFLVRALSVAGKDNRAFLSLSLLGLVASFCFESVVAYLFFLAVLLAEELLHVGRRLDRKVFCKIKSPAFWEIFAIATIFCVLIFESPGFSLKPPLWENDGISGLSNWIQTNASLEDTFLTEPFAKVSSLVRMRCGRPVYFSEKDGAQGIFTPAYAFEWRRRKDLARGIRLESEEAVAILRREGIRFLVLDKREFKPETALGDPAFENGEFRVWKIR